MPDNTQGCSAIAELCSTYNAYRAQQCREDDNTALHAAPELRFVPGEGACLLVGAGGEAFLWSAADWSYYVEAYPPSADGTPCIRPGGDVSSAVMTEIDVSDGVKAATHRFISWMLRTVLPEFAERRRSREGAGPQTGGQQR